MNSAPFAQFYKKSVPERMAILEKHSIINAEEANRLIGEDHLLNYRQADRMIENVIGVFGLPLGLGLNLQVNHKDYAVPMAVEEASILAAVSSAAKLSQTAGGIITDSDDPLLIGQVVVENVTDGDEAANAVVSRKEEILNLANSLHPNMVARGGGAKDIQVNPSISVEDGNDMLAIHITVDTRDAMGANLVNSICEGVSNLIQTITGGRVLLRILSNLSDQSLVRARLVVPATILAKNGVSGELVRDRIVSASRFAENDYHRAVTHNKGIMNGIDAVAIATGNDWRAIEAAAHGYAASNGRYTTLSRWETDDSGRLIGSLEMPLNVGIVGGSIESNPTAKLALRILNVESGRELAEVMAAVGLLQNLAALRALVNEGIQKGHMSLHARSLAQAAGADPGIADTVVERLVESGDIKLWKARQVIDELNATKTYPSDDSTARPAQKVAEQMASAPGKVVLLGEHAVLYGSRAIAAPLPYSIHARVVEGRPGVHLSVPRWGIDTHWMPNSQHDSSILKAIERILTKIGVTRPKIRIELFPEVQRAMGLGSSAAAVVAVIRALSQYYALSLSNDEVNRIAFESENFIHGSSSGMDNTVVCHNQPILYRMDSALKSLPVEIACPIPLVVGMSGKESLTAPMVAGVREMWQKDRRKLNAIFRAIDHKVGLALASLKNNDLKQLGDLMIKNHELLKQLNVSSRVQNIMVDTALRHGALGAKLTGGGGGGAIIALSPNNHKTVAAGLNDAGFETIEMTIEPAWQDARGDCRADITASNQQKLIMVDINDTVTGYCTREECHAGEGLRHRAFSIFIFDRSGRLLLQKRGADKALWPLFWSNSCCSHPLVGETTHQAAHRRLTEELGISTPLTYLFKFAYQARFEHKGSENELCSVFVGQSEQPIQADPSEIDACRHVSIPDLETEMDQNPNRFTPWFKIEWRRLRQHPMVKKLTEETVFN
jgi:hydroxymethylglutaryl-CoA reductase